MAGFLSAVKELSLRLKLYLLGIRFYECEGDPKYPLIYEAEYRVDSTHRLKIKFFRVECKDIVLKKGVLSEIVYNSYIVRADVDDTFPQDVRNFDKHAFFFNGRINGFRGTEQQVAHMLLDVYLDFLKISLNKECEVTKTC